MRVWFDTEFIDDGKTIELLSIGAVREDGAEYYAEPAETDRSRACPWVRDNVIAHLTGPVQSTTCIAFDLHDFFGERPEIWAWYAAYDWVALCQLYGRMMDIPENWPHFVRDVKTIDKGEVELPPKPKDTHHALADARWARDAWTAIVSQPAT